MLKKQSSVNIISLRYFSPQTNLHRPHFSPQINLTKIFSRKLSPKNFKITRVLSKILPHVFSKSKTPQIFKSPAPIFTQNHLFKPLISSSFFINKTNQNKTLFFPLSQIITFFQFPKPNNAFFPRRTSSRSKPRPILYVPNPIPKNLGNVQKSRSFFLDRRRSRSFLRSSTLEQPHQRRTPLRFPCPRLLRRLRRYRPRKSRRKIHERSSSL